MKFKWFTFTQKHLSGFIQGRLDYIFISNAPQKLVTTTEILTPISNDHSPVLLYLSKGKECLRSKGFWKSNSSLTKDQNYIIEMKKLIGSFCTTSKSLLNRHLKWEILKYEVRKFTRNFTKHIAKEKRQQLTSLENQLKILEKILDENDNLTKYNVIKNDLVTIYDYITEIIRIRSKCDLYEHTKNSTKFFLILEKPRGAQNTIKKLIAYEMESTDDTHILPCIKEFYETNFENVNRSSLSQ